jgi:glycerate dehydrogenase
VVPIDKTRIYVSQKGPVQLTGPLGKRKCIISHAVGTDHIDLAYCRQANIQVMTCTGCNTESVAEHALSLYFATRRSLVSVHNKLADFGPGRPNDWKSKGEYI